MHSGKYFQFLIAFFSPCVTYSVTQGRMELVSLYFSIFSWESIFYVANSHLWFLRKCSLASRILEHWRQFSRGLPVSEFLEENLWGGSGAGDVRGSVPSCSVLFQKVWVPVLLQPVKLLGVTLPLWMGTQRYYFIVQGFTEFSDVPNFYQVLQFFPVEQLADFDLHIH